MKRIAIIAAVLISVVCTLFAMECRHETETRQIAKHGYKPAETANDKLYHDAISAFLHPHIQKAIDSWYSRNTKYGGGTVDPWDTKILNFERIANQTSDLWFHIKVEVMPYVLAHISTGRDHITFLLKPGGEVTVEKFEHIESFEVPKRRQLTVNR